MKIGIKIILTVFLLISLSGFNSYSQVASKKIEQLSKNADLIITGKVIKKKSNWNNDKSMIYTDVSIEVEEYFKGKKTQKTIVVRHPGGEVGGVGEIYTHMPRFEKSEEVMLFVQKAADNIYQVADGENGKITLTKKDATPKTRALRIKQIKTLKNEISKYVKEE